MYFNLKNQAIASLERFPHLLGVGARHSMLRRMELASAAGLDVAGTILEFGGGTEATYGPLLAEHINFRSVTISSDFWPNDRVEPGAPIPYGDAHFDSAVSLNVTEHFYDDVAAPAEITRVLKPGASLHMMLPWIFPVHDHPNEFTRQSPSWWQMILDRLRYSHAALLPPVLGSRTSSLSVRGQSDKAIRGRMEGKAAVLDSLETLLRSGKGPDYSRRYGRVVWTSRPGWHFHTITAPA